MYLKAILVAAALATAPAPAAPVVEKAIRTMDCKPPDCLLVHAGDLDELLGANARAWKRVAELEEELRNERADKTKKCGVISVVPQRRTSL
jgi:hypothetical protein